MKTRTAFRFKLIVISLLISLALPLNGMAQEPAPNTPTAAGDLDPTFGGLGGDGRVTISGMVTRAMALQPDGKIVVVGIDGGDLIVRRYQTNGSPDRGFGVDGTFRITLGTGAPCNTDYSCGVALQADGKIVVAADSDNSGDQDFAVLRLTTNGQLDQTFGIGGVVYTDWGGNEDTASEVAIQVDGKIVVAGTTDEGTFRQLYTVARYNSDGSPDASFSDDGKTRTALDESWGNTVNFAKALALQADGKIIVAGESRDYHFSAENEMGFVRYHPDGSLDTDFSEDGIRTIGFGGNESAIGLVLQPDGKILAVGSTSEFGILDDEIEFRHALVRLHPNSDLDNDFAEDGKRAINIDTDGGFNLETLMAVDLQPDGKIVAAGYSAQGRIVLMRLLYNGDLDASFVGDGILDQHSGFGRDMAIQPDGKIIVLYNGGLLRFLLTGALDQAGKTATDFSNGDERAWAATVAPDGKIILAGEATPRSSSRKSMAVARYHPDGASDFSFDRNGRATATFNGDDVANDVIVHPDGSILAAGATRRTDYDFGLYRFAADGAIDESAMYNVNFGYGDDFAQEVLLQPDGKIVLAGFAEYPGNNDPDRMVFAVARFNPDYTLDNSFGSSGKVLTPVGVGPSARARAAMLQPDGKILLVGYHDREFVVIRYNPNGTLDSGFGQSGIVKVTGVPQSGGPTPDHPLDYANSVGLLRYGNIAVAGQGENKFGLLILGPDGGQCTICGNLSSQGHYWLTIDFSTDPCAAYDMFVQPNGKILMVGNRTNNNNGFYIARLRPIYGAISIFPEGYELDPTFGEGGKKVVPLMARGDYGRAVALFGYRVIIAGHSQNPTDYDFSLAALENDVAYFPPGYEEGAENTIFLPLVIR